MKRRKTNVQMHYRMCVVPLEWPKVSVILARRGRAKSGSRERAMWKVRLGMRFNDALTILDRVGERQFKAFQAQAARDPSGRLIFVVRTGREFRRAVERALDLLYVVWPVVEIAEAAGFSK